MLFLDRSESVSTPERSPAVDATLDGSAATVCFSIQAAAEPGVMPRVLELFAKRNLVPERWVSGVHGAADGDVPGRRSELMIDLQVAGLTPQDMDYLARCLGQITDVRSVLTSEKAVA